MILQSPILSIDIAPTIVELAGGKAPESMDGRSILPLLVRSESLLVLLCKFTEKIEIILIFKLPFLFKSPIAIGTLCTVLADNYKR